MEENQQNHLPQKKSGTAPKRAPKRLPFWRRIYRAVYTFFYVAAQLIKECALLLFERAGELGRKIKELFLALVAHVERETVRKRTQKQDASKQTGKNAAQGVSPQKGEPADAQGHQRRPVGVSVKREEREKRKSFSALVASFFATDKKQRYAEKDYLDFEEEPIGKKSTCLRRK